jgi:Leucine-rich repeat (LRR) protein
MPPEPQRQLIRLPRPLGTLLVAFAIAVVGFGARFGIPLYKQQRVLREISDGGGWIETRKQGPAWLRRWIGDDRMQVFEEVLFVQVSNPEFNDSGMAHLAVLTRLTHLDLSGTRVTDAGLAHLRELTRLVALDLDGTDITDAGLVHLRGLANLQQLDLSATKVTDAGIDHLKGLSRLIELGLEYDEVTEAGIDRVTQALPNLAVQRDRPFVR